MIYGRYSIQLNLHKSVQLFVQEDRPFKNVSMQLSNFEGLSSYIFGSKGKEGIAAQFQKSVSKPFSKDLEELVDEHSAWLQLNCERQISNYRLLLAMTTHKKHSSQIPNCGMHQKAWIVAYVDQSCHFFAVFSLMLKWFLSCISDLETQLIAQCICHSPWSQHPAWSNLCSSILASKLSEANVLKVAWYI